ncbi:MAG: TetR/AcrR family transcriptional regulator [Actinobacteria bacterium]|nr:TetR/AcrR family transcriptional regulator [Actinomycetota bacterium]
MAQSTSPERLSRQERGQLIEAAATRLFAQRGYASTSVEDIVAAVGVTKPMLYRHFESKRELCIRLLQRYRDELIAAALTHFSGDEAGLGSRSGRSVDKDDDRLSRMIDAWLAWVEAHPDAVRLLFVPISGDDEVVRVQSELHTRQRDSQSALLREFEPGLSEADAEPLAEITRAGLAAVALWWLAHPDRPRADARRALLTMVDGILSRYGR